MTFFLQMLVVGLVLGAVYALMSMAVVIIFKTSSIFNFAHGHIVAFSAFLMWALIVQFKIPLVAAVPLYLVVLFIIAFLIQRVVIQPLTGQSPMTGVMATIAMGEVFAGFITLVWPAPGRILPKLVPSGNIHMGGVSISSESTLNLIITILVFIVFYLFFQKTRTGLAMRGTADDHTLAQSKGIRVSWIFVLCWAVSIYLAATGGILMAQNYGVNADPLAALGMKALAVVILGGMESLTGAIVGAVIIGVAEALATGYIDPFVGGGVSEVLPFLVIFVVLFIRPYGLFGYARIERL